MTRRAMVLVLVAAALVTSAACGSDNKVGNDSLLNFKEQANSRLGETTTTTAAATTTTAGGAATSTTKPGGKAGPTPSVTAGTAPKSTPASVPSAPSAAAGPAATVREIYIYGDDAAQPLDPQIQTAYVGSIIRWINKDSVERSVRADSGQFVSPMIKPGGSWDYTAGTVGAFTYADDTRPYVKGELRVAKKP